MYNRYVITKLGQYSNWPHCQTLSGDAAHHDDMKGQVGEHLAHICGIDFYRTTDNAPGKLLVLTNDGGTDHRNGDWLLVEGEVSMRGYKDQDDWWGIKFALSELYKYVNNPSIYRMKEWTDGCLEMLDNLS